MVKKSVEFSLCVNPGQDFGYLKKLVQNLPYPAHVTALSWEEAWRAYTDYAVHQQGADVSQVGAPWVGDLIAMNALRPFTEHELAQMGGMAAFEPVAWQSSSRMLHGQVWAIPWTADPRVLFYWQDALEQAGVDEATAFQNLNQMEVTLERLQSSGIPTPWAVPTGNPLAILHIATSWVWGAGGDFARPDGRRTLFCDPPAMEGWQRYFSLYRFMPQKGLPIYGGELLELFASRQVAVTMGSLYLGALFQARLSSQDLPRLGIALPPGPALVGGSSLVAWAYTKNERETVALTAFLSSPAIMAEHCQRTGYLPTRLDVLSGPPFNADRRFMACILALQSGRPFPVIKAGGLLENSLANSLANVWQDIFQDDGQDIQAHLQQHLLPLARRLDITLSQF